MVKMIMTVVHDANKMGSTNDVKKQYNDYLETLGYTNFLLQGRIPTG